MKCFAQKGCGQIDLNDAGTAKLLSFKINTLKHELQTDSITAGTTMRLSFTLGSWVKSLRNTVVHGDLNVLLTAVVRLFTIYTWILSIIH